VTRGLPDPGRSGQVGLAGAPGSPNGRPDPEQEISIEELVGLIAKLTDLSGRLVWDASKRDGPRRPILDTSRAAASFRFVAKILFEDGLRRAIAWHHARIKAERASV
jgi:nucleoside-diphosphate-sugar epimerase